MSDKELISSKKLQMKEFGAIRYTRNKLKSTIWNLVQVKQEDWESIYQDFEKLRKEVGIAANMTTKDAHTFTDGPTIFLADDIEKLPHFA